jgi:hypothetical protein
MSPVHQNHHSTQRQYHKEHCKNDYRHNLEPSAATAFRSAQHNRLSILKLAIYLLQKSPIALDGDIPPSWQPTEATTYARTYRE